jgi:hypothetical protein
MLALQIALERLELVAGRYRKIDQAHRVIQLNKLASGHLQEISCESLESSALHKDRFGEFAFETADQSQPGALLLICIMR